MKLIIGSFENLFISLFGLFPYCVSFPLQNLLIHITPRHAGTQGYPDPSIPGRSCKNCLINLLHIVTEWCCFIFVGTPVTPFPLTSLPLTSHQCFLLGLVINVTVVMSQHESWYRSLRQRLVLLCIVHIYMHSKCTSILRSRQTRE